MYLEEEWNVNAQAEWPIELNNFFKTVCKDHLIYLSTKLKIFLKITDRYIAIEYLDVLKVHYKTSIIYNKQSNI